MDRLTCSCGLVYHERASYSGCLTAGGRSGAVHLMRDDTCLACGVARWRTDRGEGWWKDIKGDGVCGQCARRSPDLVEGGSGPSFGAKITEVSGDIFRSDARVLVSPVNSIGVSGAGLALAFKRRYPKAEAEFVRSSKSWQEGEVLVVEVGTPEAPRAVAYVPTKYHWREPSDLDLVDAGLRGLAAKLAERGDASVAMPALGCGLGGLPWADVRTHIVAYLDLREGLVASLYPPHEQAR
jgi:O-acetyl-ADP-ribose deacetylase (regulator of RNase III)